MTWLLLILGGPLPIMAQPYPVTATVQVTSFSTLPEAYDDPGRVVITLMSTDARPEYPALLRLKLSGAGFSIQTREDYLPAPLTLRRNQPLVLTGAQLQDYFDPANLTFEGIDLATMLSDGSLLPEGPVSLCAEVYDYQRFFDPPVSNTGCANGFMQWHRPPIWISPEAEVSVMPIQQIRFVWQPMHVGIAARYILEIYENRLPGFGADLILNTTAPLAVINTLTPFYLYSDLDPLLIVGQEYVVRVRAVDIAGQAAFLNDGWSEVLVFRYGAICPTPQSPEVVLQTGNSLQIRWQMPEGITAQSFSWNPENNNHALQTIPVNPTENERTISNLAESTGYVLTLHYVCADGTQGTVQTLARTLHPVPDSCGNAPEIQDLTVSPVTAHSAQLSWRPPPGIQPASYSVSHRSNADAGFGITANTTDTLFLLQALIPSTPYEARVCYTCPAGGERCDTIIFNTPDISCALAATDDYAYQCGDSTILAPNGEVPFVTTLQPGDTVWAGDFLVILSEVSGAGAFRGTGYVSAPYFEQARLRVAFNNIRVNQHCRMVAGEMEVTGAGLAILDRLNDLIDQIMDQLDQVDNILTQVEEALLIAQEIVEATATLADYNQTKKDALAAITEAAAEFPFLPDSLSENLQAALDCLNAAEDEAQFLACREQMMAALEAYQAAVNALYQNAPFQVHFSENPQQLYGFDAFAHEAHTDHYTHLNVAGQPYHVPWKSAPVSGTDRVNARAPNDLSGITFVNKNQALLPRTDSAGVATLTVTGGTYKGPAGVVYARHAGADSTDVHIAGQLHVAAYPEKPLRIVLVPVNGTPVPDNTSQTLAYIFKQAVIHAEVSIHPGFSLPDFDNTLSDAPSGLFANYNADMRALIRAFEQQATTAPDTYYLFLVANCTAPTRLGFMPRGRQYGFVFLNNHTAAQVSVARTIAHELAHGAYYLRHTFEQYPQLASGSTDNLMDYANGTHLHKYQWDLIHEPDRDWGIFEEDEESAGEAGVIASRFIYSGNIYYRYTGDAPTYTCLTPAGELYAIDHNAIAAFYPTGSEWPAGSLVGYKVNDIIFYGWRKNGRFMGYAPPRNGAVSLGPTNYLESLDVDRDSVYAARLDSICRVAVWRGPLPDAAVYETGNALLPVEVLPIEDFTLIERSPHLSPECLTDDEYCRALYADYPYLHPDSNGLIARYLKENPCMVGVLFHYDFDLLKLDSAALAALERMLEISIVVVGAPIAAELLGPYLAYYGRERIAEAAVGFTADLLLQATLKYWFPPGEPVTVVESFQGLDYYQASASAVEAMISSSGWPGLIVSAGMSCAVDGFTDQGALRDSFELSACMEGAGLALIVGGVIQSAPAIKDKLKAMARPVLVRGMIRLMTEIPDFPAGKAWEFYRLVHPERIQTEDVIHLFDVSPEHADDIADRLQNSSALQEIFHDGDWWADVRKFTDSPDLRGKLLDDLTENVNLAQALKEKPELLRAWEVALAQQSIRSSVFWLNKIEEWLAGDIDEGKIVQLLDEAVSNTTPLRFSTIDSPIEKMTLKEAFEGNHIEFDAWRRIDEGIPSLKANHSEYLLYLKKMTKYIREIGSSTENVKVYRVQGGGSGYQTSQERIILDHTNGNITINGRDELYISTGSDEHALFYINGIPPHYPPHRPGGEIVSFEIPKWLDEQMKTESIPQFRASSNSFNNAANSSPQMVDPNRPGDPFGISENWIDLFLQHYIRGSGRIEN